MRKPDTELACKFFNPSQNHHYTHLRVMDVFSDQHLRMFHMLAFYCCENDAMNLQKFLVPAAVVTAVALGYRSYGWQGVVVIASVLVFGLLLHFSRMMQVLKRAANRPIGYVDSAVMLNAKLKPSATLLHVVAMTRSLGQLKSVKGTQPEVFEWTDGTQSTVTCTFVGGKLSHHVLVRPETEQLVAGQT